MARRSSLSPDFAHFLEYFESRFKNLPEPEAWKLYPKTYRSQNVMKNQGEFVSEQLASC